jgi:hypothetical protein
MLNIAHFEYNQPPLNDLAKRCYNVTARRTTPDLANDAAAANGIKVREREESDRIFKHGDARHTQSNFVQDGAAAI